MIKLNGSRCVRSLAKESICNNCETICPTSAIVIGSNTLPSINFSQCVECGACDAVCPNEAFSYDSYKPNEFFFSYLEDEQNIISCRKNVPCIAAINIENLISIALMKKDVVFDMGYCDECEIAHKCKPQIISIYEEASYVLRAIESDAKIELKNVRYVKEDGQKAPTSRRDFFAKANVSDFVKAKKEFEDEVQKATDELVEHSLSKTDIVLLRKKRITDRRKLLFSVLKRVKKPSVFHVLEANELSFVSMKLMDRDSCTACQMCYRICPSGALSSDLKNSKIDFDPLLCIKCHSCHDVCAPNSLTLSPSFNVGEFFEPNVYALIKFNVKRCDECNMFFSSNSDDKLCYRCKAEEEEARELWGIKDF